MPVELVVVVGGFVLQFIGLALLGWMVRDVAKQGRRDAVTIARLVLQEEEKTRALIQAAR